MVEFTDLELAILRRARPCVFDNARYDEAAPGEEIAQLMTEDLFDALPGALHELGRDTFHEDDSVHRFDFEGPLYKGAIGG